MKRYAVGLGIASIALAGCGAFSNPERVLVWSDEFNGSAGSLPDPKKWGFETFGDGSGNQELQCYTKVPGNTSTDGKGNLVITAIKQPGHRCVDGRVNDYTSGRITTQGRFTQQYGRLEVRAKVPSGVGTWPAFWALGENIDRVGWPASGEIDVMEYVGRKPTEVLGTVHAPDEDGERIYVNRRFDEGVRYSDAFHVYAVEWTPERMKWSIDGKTYGEVTRADVTKKGGKWVFDKQFYLLLNLAIGGNLGGDVPESTTWPQRYIVDYVRVYRSESSKSGGN